MYVIFSLKNKDIAMQNRHFTQFDLEHMKICIIEFFNVNQNQRKFNISHTFYSSLKKRKVKKTKA